MSYVMPENASLQSQLNVTLATSGDDLLYIGMTHFFACLLLYNVLRSGRGILGA